MPEEPSGCKTDLQDAYTRGALDVLELIMYENARLKRAVPESVQHDLMALTCSLTEIRIEEVIKPKLNFLSNEG